MNILIVGVGGQGTLLASKILGAVAEKLGYDVKLSEVHGMSQRGGSVVTCVKMGRNGEKVASPIIEEGEADIILAFEQLEALRWVSSLKTDGTIIMNTQKINPMPVVSGTAKYPERIIETLNQSVNVIPLDALCIAEECGSSKAVNVVLLGVLASITPEIEKDIWIQCLKDVIPSKMYGLNEKAFLKGMQYKGECSE